MQYRTVMSLSTLVLTILVGPWLANAQGPTKVPHLGVLSQWSQGASPSPALQAFLQRLHDLGYREGENLRIDYRFAAQQLDRLPTLAAELVALQPDVIFTSSGTPALRAAQQATTTIPIVVGAASDLVAQGLVASLAQPGGNITGLTLIDEISAKRRALLKEALPTITRVAHLSNPANAGDALSITAEAYRALGLQVQYVGARHADDLDAAFRAIVAGGVDALFISADGVLGAEAPRIAAFALQHRLPTMGGDVGFVRAGGLMAYSTNISDMFRRAADYVDKILKGAKPADLPIERPIKFEFVINLKTAEALGLTLPPSILFQANEVIR
jgi:putative ABC transport system substrate-binding protein